MTVFLSYVLSSTVFDAKALSMTLLDRAHAHCQKTSPQILLPELHDRRVQAAAKTLEAVGCRILAPDMAADPEPLIDPFLQRKPSLTRDKAREYLDEPTHRAAAMLALGQGDLLISGAATQTATVLRAGLRAVGLAPEAPLICSSFLMSFPDGKKFLFGDCAVNLDPNATQLAHIGMHLATAAQMLFGHARLALLSYSTGASGSGPSVDTVLAATKTLQDKGIAAFGPIQADAALNPEIGARKGMGDARPNTLIFPNINAGNIGYKLMQELAGAQAIGPLLHGFARPMADLSRGASSDDIAKVALITALMSFH